MFSNDDMMDGAATRREALPGSHPHWLDSMNDSFMLEDTIYHLDKIHFRKESYHEHVIELLRDTSYKIKLVDSI